MIHMGYTEKEKKEEFRTDKSLLEDTPQYPCGLKLTLSPEDIKKLNIESVLKVGRKLVFCIETEVTSMEKVDNYQDEEGELRACLQVTFMEHLNTKDDDDYDEDEDEGAPVRRVPMADIYG